MYALLACAYAYISRIFIICNSTTYYFDKCYDSWSRTPKEKFGCDNLLTREVHCADIINTNIKNMNIVRGAGNIAGNIVDGTVNAVATVASVATGGLGGQSSGSGSFARRHSSMDGRPNVVLKDKVTMTIKVNSTDMLMKIHSKSSIMGASPLLCLTLMHSPPRSGQRKEWPPWP